MFTSHISIIFLSFIIYSIIGYIIEVVLCTVTSKKLVNRGFLFGPYCPIYGVGSLLITWALTRYESDLVVVFVFGVLITSGIEYYTSYLLEKIFHNKWWDYSDRRDHINGRICIGNSIAFGIGACAIIYFTNPIILELLNSISTKILSIISIVVLIIFIADLIWSIEIAYNLRSRLIIAEELKAEKLKMIPILVEKKFKEQISKIKKPNSRLLKAFPDLKNKFDEELETIRKWIIKNAKKK